MKYKLALMCLALLTSGCTQETQNVIGHKIQNWTGTDGGAGYLRWRQAGDALHQD
jgi:hypothetical protein